MIADSIEKHVTLRAPIERVWAAIADASQFGRWFGVTLEGPFVEGQAIQGVFAGPFDESAVMAYQQRLGLPPTPIRPPEPRAVFCTVVRLEAPTDFSFRWIPYGIDAEADPQTEPTTLVEFHLEAVPTGTRLTIRESGFDQVPAHRRTRAFLMNEGGWAAQAEQIRAYVDGT